MALFTCNVKNIEGAAHKNGDIDRTCKQSLISATTGHPPASNMNKYKKYLLDLREFCKILIPPL